MAYRRKSTSRTRSTGARKRRNAPARTARGRTGVRRAGRASPQTIRIVLETAGGSAVARPGAFQNAPDKPQKAKF